MDVLGVSSKICLIMILKSEFTISLRRYQQFIFAGSDHNFLKNRSF